MFEIEYKGANCVVIAAKNTVVVADPGALSLAGLKNPKTENAVEIATESRFKVKSDSVRLLIDGPGAYEIGDFSIQGVAATRHIDTPEAEKLATIYRIEIGDIRIGLIGNIAPKLDDDQLESLGMVDILIIPVGGGGYTLDATSASALVRQIDPKAVIPIHYADSALKHEVPQDSLETFIKELGAPVEQVGKYKVKAASSLPQTLTVVEVTRS